MSALADALQEALRGQDRLERELVGGGMSRVFAGARSTSPRDPQHRTIVTLLSADRPGVGFYVMPYVEGETLRECPMRRAWSTASSNRRTSCSSGHALVLDFGW